MRQTTQTTPTALVKRIAGDAFPNSKGDKCTAETLLLKGIGEATSLLRSRGASPATASRDIATIRKRLAATPTALALLASIPPTPTFEAMQEAADIRHLTCYGSSARLWQHMVRGSAVDPTSAHELLWRREADNSDGVAILQRNGKHLEGAIRHSVAIHHSDLYTTRHLEVVVPATRQWARRHAAAALMMGAMQGGTAPTPEALRYFDRLRNAHTETTAAVAAVKRALGIDPPASLAASIGEAMQAATTPTRDLTIGAIRFPASPHPEQLPVDPTLPGYPTSYELATTAPRPRRRPQTFKRVEYTTTTPAPIHPLYAVTCDTETAELWAERHIGRCIVNTPPASPHSAPTTTPADHPARTCFPHPTTPRVWVATTTDTTTHHHRRHHSDQAAILAAVTANLPDMGKGSHSGGMSTIERLARLANAGYEVPDFA